MALREDQIQILITIDKSNLDKYDIKLNNFKETPLAIVILIRVINHLLGISLGSNSTIVLPTLMPAGDLGGNNGGSKQ